DGTLLNSYSMSEYEGTLRVATTTYEYDFGGGQDNGVHVLKVEGSELKEVGAVLGLGRGEQIQGVRFDGPRGYVVTFRQVDPLYVLDLSDPEAPELVGELKVPGYSTYLKPIDGDRVIAVGMSGTETGVITGAQVSVFDVSDPSNPIQVATSEVGQMSEATWDPHAFLWWAETGQIVVPRELVCDTAGGAGCESAVVLKLEGTNLSEQGRIFMWYPIRRAVVASNRLVTVSAGGVLVVTLEGLTPVSEIRFDIPGIDDEQNLPPLVR
ncbi:MAG: beta-propeller domain-containing protein, partial [Actinomycetota bacterium]